MNKILITAAAVVTVTMLGLVGLAPSFVAADEYGGTQNWKDTSAEDMGKHSMDGTIESIDHKTGWLKLKTGMGELTLHYPPATIKELKKGDKIAAHLSYTREQGKHDDGMMKMK